MPLMTRLVPRTRSARRGTTAGDSKGRPGEMHAGWGGRLLKIFDEEMMINGEGVRSGVE